MGSNAEPSVRSGCWQGLKGKTLSKVRASALRYFTYCMQCPTRSKLIAQALCEMPQCMPHDFFFISGVFFMRFLSLVLERSFLTFFQFVGAFGGPKGGHFWLVFVKKYCFSWKGGVLVFAHPYSVLAWFSGSGTSRGSKKREKAASKLSSFFWCGKEGHPNRFL